MTENGRSGSEVQGLKRFRVTIVSLIVLGLAALGGVLAWTGTRPHAPATTADDLFDPEMDEPADYSIVDLEQHRSIPNDARADHHPPFVPECTELMSYRNELIYVNRSAAVMELDINLTPDEADIGAAGRLYPTFTAALDSGLDILPSLDMIDIYAKQTNDGLVAAIETHIHDGGRTCAGGKQGLLKALITELRAGEMDDAGKEAVAFLAAAVMLGGGKVKLSWELRGLANRDKSAFLKNPFNAKPVGIYTRTKTLKRIFQRDRLLQQPFASEDITGYSADGAGAHDYPGRSLGAAIRIAEALDRRPDLLAAYETYLALGHCLTNPDANLNLSDLLEYREFFGDEDALLKQLKQSPAMDGVMQSWYIGSGKVGVAVWPFATSKENQLMARIYQEDDPRGDIMADLVAAIRSGRLDLTPDARSGWYDYQTYALESLLLPDRAQEAAKLFLRSDYKVRLRHAFEAMLTQRRETHVKQHSMSSFDFSACEGTTELDPEDPLVTIEPLPTNYLRTARGYRMLEDRLTELLGEAELAEAMLADSDDSFLDRTREARAVFTALYLVSCNEIGMAPELNPGELLAADFHHLGYAGAEPPASLVIDELPGMSPEDTEAIRTACARGAAWADHLTESDYLNYDPRVIVPVYSSMDGTYSHYWAVVGIQLAELEIEYAVEPRVVANRQFDRETGEYIKLTMDGANELLAAHKQNIDWIPWYPDSVYIPIYVFREVRLGPEPPTREQYRAVCDKGDTADRIVKLLEKKFGP